MTATISGVRVAGSDAPEITDINVGFIPLTDCASVVLASRLGFDRRYGIRLVLHRQLSWAALRDRLINDELHAAHMLYGLVYGVQLGIGGPRSQMAVLMTLNRNGQAITFSQQMRAAGLTNGDTLHKAIRRESRTPRLAHTFVTGTHAMWLYYWLAAHEIDPLQDVHTRTVPPPQMVAKMAGEHIDGYSAGEPWNALAVATNIGFTVTTSQAIWPGHPEKVLASTAQFVQRYPNAARALVMAILDAGRYIDQLDDAREVARLIADPTCVDTPLDIIAGRLKGVYDDGRGHQWHDPNPLQFHADGEVNYPYYSDALWFMSQHRRWGLLSEEPNYTAIVESVNQTELYTEAATALGISIPHSPYRSSRLVDGAIWDGHDPEKFARRSAVSHVILERDALV